jgi:hypothetical protein
MTTYSEECKKQNTGNDKFFGSIFSGAPESEEQERQEEDNREEEKDYLTPENKGASPDLIRRSGRKRKSVENYFPTRRRNKKPRESQTNVGEMSCLKSPLTEGEPTSATTGGPSGQPQAS